MTTENLSNFKTPTPREEKPLRLLIATTIPLTIRAFLLPYADHFRARGWTVDAMATDASGDDVLREHFDNLWDVEWSRNPMSPRNFALCAKIRRIVADNAYDIVHVHTPVAAFLLRRALRKLRAQGRVKVIYTAHGFHFYKGGKHWRNFAFRALERLAGRWTDRLIVINREDEEAARQYNILPEQSLVYMPGIGLDFAAYDAERIPRDDVRSIRTELALKEDDVLFSMLAEFIPRKRHADLIEALAKTKNPNIHVAFAGDGPLRAKIQAMAKTWGVHQRTHFMGFVKSPSALILASRATVLPSDQEGLARSLMESACLGVPIIGSDARGVIDVIRPNRGLVYPTGDTYALRDAMLQMYEEPYGKVEPAPEWEIGHLLNLHDELYTEVLNPEAALDVEPPEFFLEDFED